MTSAVTGISLTPTPALTNAAVPAKAAVSMEAPSEVNSGGSPPAQAKTPGLPESEATKSAQIGVQVSNALLGLSVTDTAHSATAPDTPPPVTAAATATLAAYTEFAVGAPAASQGADNETAGKGSEEQTGPGDRNSAASQYLAGNMAALGTYAQNTSATAGFDRGQAAARSQTSFTPMPVIPQWHIRPATRMA